MVQFKRQCWLQGLAMVAVAAAGVSAAERAFAKDVIVKFRSNNQLTSLAEVRTLGAATVIDRHLAGHLLKVRLPDDGKGSAQALAGITNRPDVEYAVADFPLTLLDRQRPLPGPVAAQAVPTDQWALAKIGAQAAWKNGVGSRKVVVAVIDTGADIKHPDLKDNVFINANEIPANGIDDDHNGFVDDVSGWNFIDDSADVTDVTQEGGNPGHGTHCSGIVGGLGINGGIFGISQQIAVMPLRFIGPDGQGDLLTAIKAIDYAAAMHVDVISASWGGQVDASQAKPLIEAVGRATAAGITFVAAAGNDGASNDETEMYPTNAKFPGVISVAASGPDDDRPYWSNYGRAKVTIASPGADILSTLPGNRYGKLSGTSMATPLVAGLVGLLKSQAPEALRQGLTGPTLLALLQSTGKPVDIETACMCRIDAAAASTALRTGKLFVVPGTTTLAVGESLTLGAFGGAGGYRFSVADEQILKLSSGAVTAQATGETTVTVTDGKGQTATSLPIRVTTPGNQPPQDDIGI